MHHWLLYKPTKWPVLVASKTSFWGIMIHDTGSLHLQHLLTKLLVAFLNVWLCLLWLPCSSHSALYVDVYFSSHSQQQLMIFFPLSWITSLFHIWSQKVNLIDFVSLILCFVLYVFTWIRSIVVEECVFFFSKPFFYLMFVSPSLQELLRMRISSTWRGQWTRWEIWRSSTRSWGWRMRRWSAPLLTSWRRWPLEAVTRNSNQNMWVNVPAGPLLPPHSKAQIITLPHTWPWRKKYVFFNLPPIGLTPPPGPFFLSLRLKVIRGQGFSAVEIINRVLLIQLPTPGHSTGLMKVFPHGSFHLK